MFSITKVLVPLIIPVGLGVGYFVSSGIKKICDHYFPGKDCDDDDDVPEISQDEEVDWFWKGFPTGSQEQTDPAGEVCSETPDIDLTKTSQDSAEDDSTVLGQTDPAGEVCSKSTEHFESGSAVGEESTPAGEDLSPADRIAKTFAKITAKVLAASVHSLVLPDKTPVKGTIKSEFEVSPSPDGEDASEDTGVADSSRPSLYGNQDLDINHQHSHSDMNENPQIQARQEALHKLATFFSSSKSVDPAPIDPEPERRSPTPVQEEAAIVPQESLTQETEFDPSAVILPPPDMYADSDSMLDSSLYSEPIRNLPR